MRRGAACAMRPLLLLLCLFSLADSQSPFASSAAESSSSGLRFLHDGYETSIFENSRPRTYLGSRRLMGIALDRLPPSSQIRFYIRDGDSDGFFTTETEEIGGVAVLQIRTRTGLSDVLNRERTSRYHLKVVGEIRDHRKSHSSSLTTTVRVDVLDINDNIPLFYDDHYRVTIDEDTAVHSSIVTVSADDADVGPNGKVFYSLEDPTRDFFAVHPTSGVVSLTRPLDYSLVRHYEVGVIAEDRGAKPSSYRKASAARAVVRIEVRKVNLHSPRLSVNHLPHVVEHAHTNIYAIISVEDADVGKNGEIKSVDIIHGDPNRLFNIDKGTQPREYKLEVLKLLDRELAPTGYNLTIRAVDRGFPPRYAIANVHVNIVDINDQSPVFLQRQYEEEVSEEAPPNTAVVRVAALDLDEGNNGKVSFRILAGNDDDKFVINSVTGLISTRDWLDAEATGYYSLAVAAIDQASNAQRKQSSAKVIVRVRDANDNDPQFVTPNTEVSVDENQPVGLYVTKVLASDRDSGENGFVSYSIANLDQVPFTIDPFDGTIRTSAVLDYEAQRRIYTIKVRASDWGQPLKRETETTVKVKVRDINDQRPVFVSSVCSGWLDLDAPFGSAITRVTAIDLDEGDRVFYKLEESDLRDCWTLDSSTGVLSLSCKLRERHSQVRKRTLIINITATDGRHVSDKTTLKLVVADHKEKEKVRTEVGLSQNFARLACEDTDIAQIQRTNEENVRKNNDVEETFALFPPRYGYNTHAPEFPDNFPEQMDVMEDVEVGTVLLKVGAKDHDRGHNGRMIFAISSGDVDSVFEMDTDAGILTLGAPLDRERTGRYHLNISVYDLGVPHKHSWKHVTIDVLDVNDNAPQFSQLGYSLHLPENMRNGTSVAHISASDRDSGVNGKVTYELLTRSTDFSLDPISGILYMTGTLDRERRDDYDLRIRAWDNAVENRKSTMARVFVTVLDVNDCVPDFGVAKHLKLSIPEDYPVGAVVATLRASDRDSGPGGVVSYSLLSGADRVFRIDPETGILRVVSPLAYGEKQLYNVTVRARDAGFPILSSVATMLIQITNVDENSSPPRLPSRIVKTSVLENQPPGTFVTLLTAFDPDGGGIHYDIVGGSGYGIFTITRKGEIRTLRRLDRETVKGYWLTVIVSDGGTVPQSDTCHIYVDIGDVNDHVPQTELPVYRPTVSESAPIGTTVVILKASDGDLVPSNITYFISRSRRRRNGWMLNHPEGEEDAIEVFDIDKLNGVITTTALLDRERQSEYDLWVGVTDGQLTSLTPIFIVIIDVNDNDPEFMEKIYRFNVPALKKPSKGLTPPLFRVFAGDKDVGRNADIRYSGKTRGRFKIDENTGEVFAIKSLPAGHTFDLTVRATDNGNPQRSSTSHVIVRMEEVPTKSKTPPEVETPPTAHVMETDKVGHVVAFITAFDRDNDTLLYYLREGNEGDRFSIGLGSGLISLAKELDREHRDHYKLTVAVTDRVYTTRVQVNVQVMDFNDHRPVFGDVLYRTSVSEDLKVGSTLMKLSCHDRDSLSPSSSSSTMSSFAHPSSSLFFKLHHAENLESRDLFTLDPTSGKLLLAQPLNRELHTSHMLTVSCQDRGGIQREDISRVIITVDDTNDHVPKFLESMIEGQVSEGAAVGSVVTRVTAVDEDEGENGRLSYSIIEGNQGGAFTIDEELGSIHVLESLTQKYVTEYLLLVRAIDHALTPKSASVPVRITVKSTPDSPPIWTGTGLPKVVELSEWTALGTVITLITATSPFNLHYEISAGNSEEETFAVTPSSGVLTLKLPLDYETTSWFNLTISATNTARVSRTTWVCIRVLDENDWRPEWEKVVYEGYALDSAIIGSPVLKEHFQRHPEPLTVLATDRDTAKNGRVTYSILEQNIARLFSVNEYTGAVRVAQLLDELAGKNIVIHVWARDSGNPRREVLATAIVNIKIRRTSIPQLVFDHDQYESNLYLPAVRGVKVTCVDANVPNKRTTVSNLPSTEPSQNYVLYKVQSGDQFKNFELDPRSGCIYVSNHLEMKPFYNLTVSAYAERHVQNFDIPSSITDSSKTTTSVLIRVNSLPRDALKFTKQKYRANVLENSTTKLNLLVVGVKGLPVNHHVNYSLLNANDYFQIRPTSGVLRTTGKPFDREKRDHFLLVVQVRDVSNSQKFGLSTINVDVLDVNDNKPIFVGQPYDVLAPTSAQRGHVVTKVRAIDADSGVYGEVRYELVRGSGELFSVGKISGNIVLKQPLTPPDKTFSLTVAAYDGAKQPRSSQAHIIIRVVSAEGPLFERSIFRVKVPENKPLKTAVTRIEAQSSSENDIIYSIVAGDPDGLFDLDYMTGVVRVASTLDYESSTSHNLTIRARDPLTGLHSDCQVLISVLDVNDNPPEFEKLQFDAEVSEAAHVGFTVFKLRAFDLDTGLGGTIRYECETDCGNFSVDPHTGHVVLARILDAEYRRRHKFNVIATDLGLPALSSTAAVDIRVLDLNDNAPIWNQRTYHCRVSNEAKAGHVITSLRAQDPDASKSDGEQLVYDIVAGDPHSLFHLDRNSGLLSVTAPHKLRGGSTVGLNVSASDGVHVAFTSLRINILAFNVNSPKFSKVTYEAKVFENVPPGQFVLSVLANDPDGDSLGTPRYEILNQESDKIFSIDQEGKIFTEISLDRETNALFEITVSATDAGGFSDFTTVRIYVLDENDNPPVFALRQYQANIPVDSPPQTLVLEVTAEDSDEDENSGVLCSLYEDDNAEALRLFSVQPSTGQVILNEPIEGRENEVFQFFIRATDGGSPPLHSDVPVTIFLINAHERAPFCPIKYAQFFLQEDAAIGTVVTSLWNSGPMETKYSILSEEDHWDNTRESLEGSLPFGLSPSGAVIVKKPLDHETKRVHKITVVNQTLTTPPLVDYMTISVVVMDVNDCSPEFSSTSYHVNVAENSPLGAIIAQITATDKDEGNSGQIQYTLKNTTDSWVQATVSIDPHTGSVRLGSILDREQNSSFSFTVVATDSGAQQLSAETEVHVTIRDFNDNPPVFSKDVYVTNVLEDTVIGTVIVELSTEDDDIDLSTLDYFVMTGDDGGRFLVHDSGQMYVARPLDREKTDHYTLIVTATDGKFSANTTVFITVIDVNDNGPECQQSSYHRTISEDVAVASPIVTVSVYDPDEGFNSKSRFLLSGEGSADFSVDQQTGKVITAKRLDRETTDSYALTISVEDWQHSEWNCRSLVFVSVSDVNDNSPTFLQEGRVSLSISEGAAVNAVLSKMVATDLDLGANGRVRYSLTDSADGYFSIDAIEGILSLAKSLDRELTDVYKLVVRAKDSGTPSFSSTSLVTVTVTDMNDNPPEFIRTLQQVTIAENAPIGTDISRVMATSKDIGINAEITYQLEHTTEKDYLRIHPKTGVISINTLLDYEDVQLVVATVIAKDGGSPSLSSTALLNVTITDVNDNSPVFSQAAFEISVAEDQMPGRNLLQITANDADCGRNGEISYSVSGGNTEGCFAIEQDSGILFLNRPLDREQLSEYEIEITGRDKGSPSNSATTVIKVKVLDVNDNSPKFLKRNYTLIIQENRGVGYAVIRFKVTDADDDHNGRPFTWELLGHTPLSTAPFDRPFTLDQDGTLRLATNQLDHRIKNLYQVALRVWDSGSPPLSADMKVDIRIVEESRYAPTVFPLRATIVSYLKPFPGGVVGKVTAHDQDPYDSLKYSTIPYIKGQNYFEIDEQDGNLVALTPLDAGRYKVNISVTDGKFERVAEASVDVFVITDHMVEQSVIVRIGDMLSREFLSKYRKTFLTTVAYEIGAKKDKVKILSIQPTVLHTSKHRVERELRPTLDVLLIALKKRGGYMSREEFIRVLKRKSSRIRSTLSLSLFSVMESVCPSDMACTGNGRCMNFINVSEVNSVPINSQSSSLITPSFYQEPACVCDQGFDGEQCETLVNECGHRPCSEFEICTPSETLSRGFTCHCPKGMAGPRCDIDTSNCKKPSCHYPVQPLSFKGKSYAQYSVQRPLESNFLHFSSYIRTRNPVGVVFYASGNVDYNILEVSDGYIQYRWNCGSGEGLVRVPNVRVDDNQWHSINLTRQGTVSKLFVDGKVSSGAAPGVHDVLNLESGNFYLGSKVETYMEAYRSVQSIVEYGFVGCIDLVILNKVKLPVTLDTPGSGKITLKRLANVELQCPKSLPQPGVCSSHPCLHGGTCHGRNQTYSCSCQKRFTGKHCQLDTDPCASSPCLNGGNCSKIGHIYVCSCPSKLSGNRCEYGVFCNPNPCQNGGRCEEGSQGPICKCQHFTGRNCEMDIDECTRSPCQNGGTCVNLYGSFRCLCPSNVTGEYCTKTQAATTGIPNFFLSFKELVYILAIILAFIIILLVVVAWQRKKWMCKRHEQNNRVKLTGHHVKNDLKANDVPKRNSKICNVEADQLQQGPLLPRPSSYTPSGTADSVLLHTLKQLADLSATDHEAYELSTLSRRKSNEYLHNLSKPSPIVVPTLAASPSANDARNARKPWYHHNNLNESYFTPSKEVSFDLPPNLDDHPRPVSPCLNSSFSDNSNASNQQKQRAYQWDDYDIRGSTSMLTFSSAPPGGRSDGKNNSQLNHCANEADPLIDSSSEHSSATTTALVDSCSPPRLREDVDGNSYSFDHVLQVNNISVASSDDADSENERNEAGTPQSQETIKYNIVSEEEEKISNIPSPSKRSTHSSSSPLKQSLPLNKNSIALPNNSTPLPSKSIPSVNHSMVVSKNKKKLTTPAVKKNSDRFGSPRSRRPYIRSDFGRVSDVSFISSLDDDDDYETLTKESSKANNRDDTESHYL